MIRRCTDDDIPTIHAIINEAAAAYREAIPPDCWHEPYMRRSELENEIAAGVGFWGWEEAGVLVGVMGLRDMAQEARAALEAGDVGPPARCLLEYFFASARDVRRSDARLIGALRGRTLKEL